jgi:chaperonin GroEL (HSP60 family)
LSYHNTHHVTRLKRDAPQVAEIEEAERDKMRQKCKRIIDHGVNVFVNRQLIYNFAEQIFAEAGVMAIEHADFEGVERLAAVTGALQLHPLAVLVFNSLYLCTR